MSSTLSNLLSSGNVTNELWWDLAEVAHEEAEAVEAEIAEAASTEHESAGLTVAAVEDIALA